MPIERKRSRSAPSRSSSGPKASPPPLDSRPSRARRSPILERSDHLSEMPLRLPHLPRYRPSAHRPLRPALAAPEDTLWVQIAPWDGRTVPGYLRPCRFCGKLVEENSVFCPFCARPHPLIAVCPYCLAPISPGWTLCNACGQPLVIPCPKCSSPVGPDTDECERCHAVVRYRCPSCAAVIALKSKRCERCGSSLKKYWVSKGL